jgi:YggT family protein
MSLALYRIIAAIVQVFIYLIFARVIASFFVRDWSRGIPRFLYDVTEPVLAPVRRVVPPIGGALDISPLIVGFGLQILLQLVGTYFVAG